MHPRSLPRLGRLAGAVIALCLLPAVTARADSSPTVHASAAEVSRLLFVAGDVRRLERNPS